ncbi:putative ATP-dependent helicase IRC3 [Mucor circinelloides]
MPLWRLRHVNLVLKRYNSSAITYGMLRPYQKECIETTVNEFNKGCTRQIVSLPVGSGKTVIMSNLIPLIPSPTAEATKVLLLAHRTELLDQAHDQIKRYNPDLNVQVEQGKRKVDIEKADVIIASVPTLGRQDSARISQYDPDLFKAVLIDEAHHATADTYKRILEYFDFNEEGCKKLLWGCTATVKRHDGEALQQVFDRITYHKGFMEMIEKKYLCPMRVTIINTMIDLSAVRSTSEDFVQKDLAEAVNTNPRNQVIVSSWMKYAHEKGRKATLVFAVDINHTIELCNAFIDAGINAKFITSKSNAIERLQVLEEFRQGKIPVLVNCAILTEGTDIPIVDCILLTRPTQSTTLFQQMFGRGLRLFPGKEDCLVIDFEDNFTDKGKHSLITIPTLLGLNVSSAVENQDILELEEQAIQHQSAVALQELQALKEQEKREAAALAVDPNRVKIKVTEYDDLNELIADLTNSEMTYKSSPHGWIDVGDDKCVLHVPTKGHVILERSRETQLWTGAFRYQLPGTSKYAKPVSIHLEAAQRTEAIRGADTWIRKKFPALPKYIHQQMWKSAPFRYDNVTDAQLKALRRYKIEIPSKITKGQAMVLLTKLQFGQLAIWKNQIDQNIKLKKAEKKKQTVAVLSRKHDHVQDYYHHE